MSHLKTLKLDLGKQKGKKRKKRKRKNMIRGGSGRAW